ncbi:MAG: hypothetical protein JEZ09_13735 [Salinivirgaceae bacterium]|nr:hypothetical protein [Salinivirgaceae bacterium]
MNIILSYIRYIVVVLLVFSGVSCKRVVLKINEVPPNTPIGADIFVAGNFNIWDPGDDKFRMTRQRDSSYIFELPFAIGKVEYKFTRGDWTRSETDRCGNEIENRFFQNAFGDTLIHTIESWKDLDPVNCDSVTIIVDKLPESTPSNEPIKIAGSFNAWNPGTDEAYYLKKDTVKNQYVVTVPRKSYDGKSSNILTYKFVREDISVSETDEFGREINPRILNFEKGDTIKTEIKNWVDAAKVPDASITIIINSLPKNTPKDEYIYLVGNFNNWNPMDSKYIFEKNSEGLLEINIPRERYGLSFKITRGSWAKEFTDKCGNIMSNQDYNYDDIDTLVVAVYNWRDKPKLINTELTIVLNNYPKNTPSDAQLQICNQEMNQFFDFPVFKFEKRKEGYVATMKRDALKYHFIITRGSYLSQEVTKHGEFVSPRTLFENCDDTVYIKVDQWNDMVPDEQMVTLVIKKLPKRTPDKAKIYLAGKFNGWNPSDKAFILTKDSKGYYNIKVPHRFLKYGYKFTRGNWKSVEGNLLGSFRDNRFYKGNASIIELEIKSWEDKGMF